MLAKKLYVSATDATGDYVYRGMASEEKALKVLEDFIEQGAGAKATYGVISGHDGRVDLRKAGDGGFEAEVVGARRRARMLWGLLPERAAFVWSPRGLDAHDARSLVKTLYALPREAFERRVREEAAR